MCMARLGWPEALGVSGPTKSQAVGLCTELKVPHGSNCISCARKNLRRVAIVIPNIFPSLQILIVFDFLA